MILGTQWYILFNVIAGASAFPTDLREAAGSFHLKGWRWWVKVDPARHFPLLHHRRHHRLRRIMECLDRRGSRKLGRHPSDGHGSRRLYRQATEAGDFPRVVLGIAVMCILVTLFNRLLWRPLYAFGERRLRLG